MATMKTVVAARQRETAYLGRTTAGVSDYRRADTLTRGDDDDDGGDAPSRQRREWLQ